MGEHVLIVDDNAVNERLLRIVLERRGFEVRSAANAAEALAAIGAFHPRLILMDLQLPGMDGLELTRRLKADPATRPIWIVAVTALAMKKDEERALAAGCDAFVTKPIDTTKLPALVRDLLSRGAAV